MNNVVLIGRNTKPIELKVTNSGKSIASFTLAVNRGFKNAEGKYDADFINCVAFDQKAEVISRSVQKGDRFGIVGRLNTRTYDKADGSKVYVTEVIVESFDFLESKKDKPYTPDIDVSDFEEITDDDELPFG